MLEHQALAQGLRPPASAAQANATVNGAPAFTYRPAEFRPIPSASAASPTLNPIMVIQALKSCAVIETKPLRWYMAESAPALSDRDTPSLRPGSVGHQGCHPDHQPGHREESVKEVHIGHLTFSFDALGDDPRWPILFAPNSASGQGLFTDRCNFSARFSREETTIRNLKHTGEQ